MDTRTKIIPLADAPPQLDTVVAGFFDPLVSHHAQRLAAHGSGLTISLLDPPDPLLPTRARAELLAALACVHQVILGDARPRAARVIDESENDLATRAALVGHILSRR